MEANKFFLYVNRLNSILLLISIIIFIGFSSFMFNEINRNSNRRTVEVQSPKNTSEKKEKIELSDVFRVYGYDHYYVQAESRKDGVLVSGGYTRTVRNFIFLDPKGNQPKWLFDTNDYVIDSNSQLDRSNENKERITDYFYFEVITQDTNSDGLLSTNDTISVAISDPFGSNMSFLLNDAKKIFNFEYNSGNQNLEILMQVQEKIVFRIYSLKTNKLVNERFVINV